MVSPLLEQAPWLTPISLFVLLNVVIATILVSTSFNKPNKANKERTLSEGDTASTQPSNPPQLHRAPSLFSRVTSFNFSNYYSDNDNDNDNNNDDYNNNHQHQQQQQQQLPHIKSAPSLFSRVTSWSGSGEVVPREVDPEPKQGLEPRAVPRAPSLLSRVASFTIGGRSSTQGEMGEMDSYRTINRNDVSSNNVNKGKKKKKKTTTKEVEDKTTTTSLKKEKNEEEVDAKADDFINRFKQQLKLQRIESLMRRQSA